MILREQVMFHLKLLPNMSIADRAPDHSLLHSTLCGSVPIRYFVGEYEWLLSGISV